MQIDIVIRLGRVVNQTFDEMKTTKTARVQTLQQVTALERTLETMMRSHVLI